MCTVANIQAGPSSLHCLAGKNLQRKPLTAPGRRVAIAGPTLVPETHHRTYKKIEKKGRPMTVAKRNNVHDLGGPGPVLLLAHGFGCNQSMWDDLIPFLRSTHRIVTFDYVGSGGSDLASFDGKRYSHLEGYARRV